MIKCEQCLNWFHCLCVEVSESDLEKLQFVCMYCKTKEVPAIENQLTNEEKMNFSFISNQLNEENNTTTESETLDDEEDNNSLPGTLIFLNKII